MLLKGASNDYELGPQVAQDDRFDIYLCKQAGNSEKDFLLVVAQEGMNAVVDRWAFVLRELAQHAERLEREYAAIKKNPKDCLNYQLGFPVLVETFKSPKKRRIMILAFENSTPSAMVPIAKMVARDRLRVDIKTSVWMMGKLLKILAFTQSQNISVGLLDSGNILIDPEQHYVNVFDWSEAQINPSSLDDATKQREIGEAANVIVDALGGDVNAHTIPNNEGDEGERYCAHLWTLVEATSVSDAAAAHKLFYEFVETLWARKFYPFTTFSRGA